MKEKDLRNPLPRSFYTRNPEKVACDLLGKRLVRVLNGALMEGIVVETEAYYGANDPASRAFFGKKNYNRLMWEEPGRVFVYNVHKYWMFNIIAHEYNQVGAVLIRALEPIRGLKTMYVNRSVNEKKELTNGPGKLTIALGISKNVQGISVLKMDSLIRITDTLIEPNIGTSRRIGVSKDLDQNLRFYIIGNPFTSR